MARVTDSSQRLVGPGAPSLEPCRICVSACPDLRYLHYLTLSRLMTFEQIGEHIHDAVGQTLHETSRVDDHVHGVLSWLGLQREYYSDYVDEATGEILPWQVARAMHVRKHYVQTARDLYEAEQRQKTPGVQYESL